MRPDRRTRPYDRDELLARAGFSPDDAEFLDGCGLEMRRGSPVRAARRHASPEDVARPGDVR
jgi:hypothetical protein